MSVRYAPEFVPRGPAGYPEDQGKGRGGPGRGTTLAPVFEDGNPGNQAKGRQGRGRGQGRKGKRREAPPAAPPLTATSIESAGVESPTAPGTRATPHRAAKDQTVRDFMKAMSSMEKRELGAADPPVSATSLESAGLQAPMAPGTGATPQWPPHRAWEAMRSMEKHKLGAADKALKTTISALNLEPRAASFATKKPVRKHGGTETSPRLLTLSGKAINALNLEPTFGYFPTRSEIRAATSGSASTPGLLGLHAPSGSGGSATVLYA